MARSQGDGYSIASPCLPELVDIPALPITPFPLSLLVSKERENKGLLYELTNAFQNDSAVRRAHLIDLELAPGILHTVELPCLSI
jgi:hypothetical protein